MATAVKKRGRPPVSQDGMVRMYVSIPHHLYRMVKQLADEHDLPISSVIRRSLRRTILVSENRRS